MSPSTPTSRAGRWSAATRATALLACLVLLSVAGPPSAAAPATSAYAWPVPGHPVRGFEGPTSPYAAGHRGVDLPVGPGDPVRAMAGGTVIHAGPVAGDVWVTVQHPDGIRTSYGPLRAAGHVVRGASVDATSVVGTARGDAHGTAGRLHVGARRGDRYVDPATLVAGTPKVATLVGRGDAAVVAGDPAVRPTLVPGAPPSPNHLVVLPGLASRTGAVPFDLDDLGHDDDTTWQQYSYAGVGSDGQPLAYGPEDTWGRVHDMAVALRDQLRAHASANPGEAVDLVGHSLGGLVSAYYLLVLHDPTDPGLPPVARVVTVASPLRGTDSADAVARVRDSVLGRAILGLVQEPLLTDPSTGAPVVHPDVAVLQDLQTDSEVARAVTAAWQRHLADPHASPLATGTEVLTVGSMLDPVVTEHRSGLPGADHRTVFDPNPVDAHGGATTDARTEELVAAFLAGEPLPARDLVDHVVDRTSGVGSGLVAAVEQLLAAGIDGAGRLVAGPGRGAHRWTGRARAGYPASHGPLSWRVVRAPAPPTG